MTPALSLMAKDRNGPKIGYQILMIPATDASVDTESYREYGTGRFLARSFMKYGWDLYAPATATRNNPYVSPLRASAENLKGLPPALVVTAENDPLRDEGEAYARKLKDAGVQVNAVRYNGTIHDFVLLNALRNVPSTECQTASNFGSDSLLMKSAGGDVLICGENQHHASIVAAILVGTQRFCCCECSPRFREDHDHGSCVEGIFGMSILRYRFAARAQSVPSSGRRPAAVGKKRRVGGHCAPLPMRGRIVRPANLRRAVRHQCSGAIGATDRAARLHRSPSWPCPGRTSRSEFRPKADAPGQQ
jgi:hypothetical protein